MPPTIDPSSPASSSSNDVFHALDAAVSGAVVRAAPAVVHVERPRSGGSGIAWADDLVISASFHTPDRTRIGIAVAGDDGAPLIETVWPGAPGRATPPDGGVKWLDAVVIGRDPGTDLALLRVTGGGLAAARLRTADVRVGQLALALGRPGKAVRASLRAIGVVGPELRTPHDGRLDRYVESDRQIPRGFAGGPLVDSDGAVIGMNTRTLIAGHDVAVPVATIRRVVDELLAHGSVRRGYLGVGAYPATLPRGGRGALIASLDDDGPAAAAGVLVGDILVKLAGDVIEGPDDLRAAIVDRAGDTVELEVLRGGVAHAVSAQIGHRP